MAKKKEIELAGALEQIEQVASKHGLMELQSGVGPLVAGLKMAEGLERLREMITPEIMERIMPLQGTALGFVTDKDRSGGYSESVVKECVIEAMIRGIRVIGGEMCIIGGHLYITKAGICRLVDEFPGLTNLNVSIKPSEKRGKQTVVPYSAKWILNEVPDSVDGEVEIVVHEKYTGPDAIRGKATRKVYAQIYGKLTGAPNLIPEGEVEVLPPRQQEAPALKTGTSQAFPQADDSDDDFSGADSDLVLVDGPKGQKAYTIEEAKVLRAKYMDKPEVFDAFDKAIKEVE